MEIKKSFKADLRNRRSLFLEIGLLAALILVIAAFSYTPQEYAIKPVGDLGYMPEAVELPPVTSDQSKPAEPRKIEVKVFSDLLQVMPNDQQIKTNFDTSEFDPDAIIVTIPPVPKEEETGDEIFLIAETMPSFLGGGLDAFRGWVLQNVKFPQIALDNNIQGRVVLSFVVEKDGRLTNIQVIQAPDRSLSEEAVRVLSKSPKWTPGKQRNQTVRVRYTLPVDFRVQN